MSSLRRIANSPFWVACFTLPDGTRTNRSTKTANRGLALRVAAEWQAAATKAREGRLVEAQARSVLNTILALVGQEEMSSQTVEAFLHQWQAGKGNGGTARRYAGTVKSFLAHLGPKASGPVSAVSHEDILGFIDGREAAGMSPATMSVDVKSLSAAFNLARKLGLVTANPVERALALRPIRVESSRRECFTPEQVTALLGTAEGDWRTMVLAGFYTGIRISDMANMRWANVDLARGVIDFEPQKTKRKRQRVVVPIHPDLRAHLERLTPAEFVCATLAGTSTGGKNGLSGQFSRLMGAAGISTLSGPGKGVRRFAALSFHSLRHSFNSGLCSAGVEQGTRMALSGHSSAAMSVHYAHLDELPKLRAAIEKLPPVFLHDTGT